MPGSHVSAGASCRRGAQFKLVLNRPAMSVLLLLLLVLQSLSVENLVDVWQASEDYSAPQLAKRCVLFALEHVTDIIAQYGGGATSIGGGGGTAATTTTAAGGGGAGGGIGSGGPARSASAASSSSQCTGSQGTGSPCSSSGSQVRCWVAEAGWQLRAWTESRCLCMCAVGFVGLGGVSHAHVRCVLTVLCLLLLLLLSK